MNIEVLFENKNVLIINKPAGLVVHADGKTQEETLVDWILKSYPEIQGVGENMFIRGKNGEDIEINRPGIVHRIDRDTSGCLIIAKHQKSFLDLKQKFKKHEIEKKYQALVYGVPKQESGIIDAPIGRSSKDFRMKQAGIHARGVLREAITEYFVLSKYEDTRKKNKQNLYEKYALLECNLKTGRTHQIRVHLKYINHPIVADSLYRGKRKECLGLTRTALHAYSISFYDFDKNNISVRCEIAQDFQKTLSQLTRII